MTSSFVERSPSPDALPAPSGPGSLYSEPNASPLRPPKNLVLCLDGTGKRFSAKNTNVMKIFDCLVKNKPENQVVYYQTGVGTTSDKSVITPFTSYIAKYVDLAIGWYLDSHVIEAYRFVQEHYTQGDRISIFGYSRGAYTARALCGFLHAIGLLPKSNTKQVDYAYQIWKTGDQVACDYYKEVMSQDVDIEFVGCFDTVSSVGAIIPRVLPFSTHNGKTWVFRHALALDEYRVKFRQETWHYSLPEKTFSIQDWVLDKITLPVRFMSQWLASEEEREVAALLEEYKKIASENEQETSRAVDVKEVWFAGGHGDVGGGNTIDFGGIGLSYIPLRWMIKEAIKADTGILFDERKLNLYGLALPTQYGGSNVGGEPDGDACFYLDAQNRPDRIAESRASDVKASSHVDYSPFWWPLEFLPVLERKQADLGKWVWQPHFNLFSPRTIPHSEPPLDSEGKEKWEAKRRAGIPAPGPSFHRSVLERMQLRGDPDVYSRSRKTYFLKAPYHPFAEPQNNVQPVFVE